MHTYIQVSSVQSIIEELMVEDTPQIMVLNKIDRVQVMYIHTHMYTYTHNTFKYTDTQTHMYA